ncbi:MAG: succinate dehydrogenase cytochrome b subunit [Cytophagales bacterium]|nr:succinate dehydrogenase cytochrome b subunit [Cytophagales bacterium]
MNWFTQALSSTLGKKLIMALTGLFLITFLVVHVSGNLLLLKDDGGQAFNLYTAFMTTNPVIGVLSYVNYTIILLHIVYAFILTIQNRKARPVGYAVSKPAKNSHWTSRNMGILGTLILVSLIVHLRGFWYEFKFGAPPKVTYADVGEVKDMYAIVVAAYTQGWYALFYVISMFFVAFHLFHGFKSAFQTLGLTHKKYTPFIEKVGIAFSIIVPGLFAVIPIWIYFRNT